MQIDSQEKDSKHAGKEDDSIWDEINKLVQGNKNIV